MAMKSVRQIEEILRQSGMDPRQTAIICEIAERLKVQHQQDAAMAEVIGRIIDQYQELSNKLASLGMNVEGVLGDKIKALRQNHSDLSKVDEQDEDTEATHNFTRKPN